MAAGIKSIISTAAHDRVGETLVAVEKIIATVADE